MRATQRLHAGVGVAICDDVCMDTCDGAESMVIEGGSTYAHACIWSDGTGCGTIFFDAADNT